MANEDFLNIWVVVHDKATNSLNALSHKIKGLDDDTRNLDNSISKLDDTQAKNANTFLRAAKGVDVLTQNLNAQAKARKANADAMTKEAQQTKKLEEIQAAQFDKYRRQRDAAYAENASFDKRAIADRAARAEKEAKDSLAREQRLQGDLIKEKERAAKEAQKVSERAARDAERAAKDVAAKQLRVEQATARDIDRFRKDRENAFREDAARTIRDLEKLRNEQDRNAKQTTTFSRALESLTNHLNNAHNSSNTFYVRILGLRLSMIALGTALPLVIDGITQLGGLLVAVADAAALAGAAIGGVLIAGIAQAVPVLGLLILAFKQLFNIIKLTGQQQKQQNADNKKDDQDAIARARHINDQVKAHQALAAAQRDLIKARKDAVNQIQDLNAAEQQAILNSRNATLGLIGSRDALASLIAGGGSSLDIASAQLDVQGAQQNVGAASLAQTRASSAASTARKQGVSGNPNVIAAQQAIVQQRRDMALANQEYAASLNKVTVASQTYQQALAKLNPAQRRLFNAIVDLRKEFSKDWKGITDPIINAFTGVVKGITSALKDPQIQDAFKSLSGGIGSGITQSISFFGTPEARAAFLQIMKDAKANLPLIANIFKDITILFTRIAVVVGPKLHTIFKDISDFFDKITQKSGSKNDLSDFFDLAFKSAYAFWRVFTGIVDIFVTLGQEGGAATGIKLVGQLADWLHSINSELQNNPGGVKNFFGNLGQTVGDLGKLLDHVLRAFVKISATGVFDKLIQVLDKLVLPLLEQFLILTGEVLAGLLDFALAHPTLVKTAVVIGGIGLAIYKIIGLAYSASKAIVALGIVTEATEGAALLPLTLTIGGIAIAIIAVAAAVFLLDRKFHFIQPTIQWIIDHWKLLILAMGPFGVIAREIIVHFDDIKVAAQKMWEIIKPILDQFAKDAAFVWDHGLKQILDGLNHILDFLNGNSLDKAFEKMFGGVVKAAEGVINTLKTIYGFASKIAGLAGNNAPPPSGPFTKGQGLGSNTRGAGNAISLSAALGVDPLSSGGGGRGNQGFLSKTGDILPGSATGVLRGSNTGDQDISASNVGGDSGKAQSLARRAMAIADLMDTIPRTDTQGRKIRGYPYAWGGGHGALGKPSKAFSKTNKITHAFEVGFDCSGAVSAVLGAIGAISGPMDSGSLASRWGKPAKGDEPIVVYANNDHAWMTIMGVPFSTGSGQDDNGFGRQRPGGGPYTARTLPQFATGGLIGGNDDMSGTPQLVIAHTGEMVLNAAQQAMLGGRKALSRYLGFASSSGNQFAGGGVVQAQGGRVNPSGGANYSSLNAALNDPFKFLTLTIQDILDQAQQVFKDKSKVGATKLIAVLDQFGGVFDRMATGLTTLVSKQRSRLINRRYKVSGASGNTTVRDTGSDAGDAAQGLANLGFDRDNILAQTNAANQAVAQVQNELSHTKNKAKRGQLQGVLNSLKQKQQDLQGALDQNTLDIVAQQQAVIQGIVDQADRFANRIINSSNIKIAIAKITGVGKGSIPDLINQQLGALIGEKGPLQQALAQAQATGNTTLAQDISDKLESLDQQIAQGFEDRFQAISDAVDETFGRQLGLNDVAGRLAGLGGNSFKSLQNQSGVLANRGTILQGQLAATQGLFGAATSPADVQAIQDKITELTTQIAENTDAQRENTEQINQARVDRLNNFTGFRSGVNSGIGGLLNSIGQSTGAFDTNALFRSLFTQGDNLKAQGAGLRDELLKGFGINLSSDPQQLINQLLGTDFGAIEFGMDDNTKSLFEGLINGILGNAQALVDNTNQLNEANGQAHIQDWSSSLWQNFRTAIFDGNNGLLAQIPGAASGAQIMSGGLLRVHAGETVVPASVSQYTGGDANIQIMVDNRGEGDVDTMALSKRISWELKHR